MMSWFLDPARWFASWHATEWTVWLAVLLIALPYGSGVVRLWQRAGSGRGIARWRAGCYAAGVAALLLALASPLDTLADGLFAAHMIQHLLLIAVVPPLLIAGAPLTAWAWLPVSRTWTRSLARMLTPAVEPVTRPVVAFAAHTATLWMWHLPGPYQLALRHDAVHVAEHATLLMTAWLVWWTALGPRARHRNGRALGMLVLLATAMQTGALGALFATSRTPWYQLGSSYAAAFHLTPLADQQLAGLLMWIPGGIIYTLAACGLFLAWFGSPRRIPGAVAELASR
ncbi:MAG: cytochrome c oxidase assembly protein [Gemmatimonadales bacterium]